ncbi:MAG: sugar transferase [Allomuricauda sp.]|nr:MAG: sugar transferase [Allomuricauda sp.]
MLYSRFIKTGVDFIVALIAAVLLSPIILVLIILLTFANNGKPFFFQKRPGKNEKIFSIIKFKTMNDKKDEEGNLRPDKERITKVGSFVRKTSLDELLQLINVIKGDMSIVGPRPLLVDYLPLYNQEEAKRHLVKPGITGWAQINGRNAISWEKRLKLDVWYVENISFLTDLKILFKTVEKVIKQDGATTSDNDTMGRFMGTSNGNAESGTQIS